MVSGLLWLKGGFSLWGERSYSSLKKLGRGECHAFSARIGGIGDTKGGLVGVLFTWGKRRLIFSPIGGRKGKREWAPSRCPKGVVSGRS